MKQIIAVHGTSYECADKVKTLLHEIRNLRGFQAYNTYIPEQYHSKTIYGQESVDQLEICKSYSLILQCQTADKEVWIESASCGYAGAGPRATSEILQMLGVRMDYSIIFREDRVNMMDINTEQKLNFIVVKYTDDTEAETICLNVQLEFKTPFDRIQAFDQIETLGELMSIEDSRYNEEQLFNCIYAEVEGSSKYKTNCMMYIRNDYFEVPPETIELIINNIANKFNATKINIKKYELAT